MAQSPDLTPRQKILSALSLVLQQGRVLIVGVVIAAVAFLIVYAIWTQIAAKRADSAAAVAEAAQKDFESWQSETDNAKKADLEKKVVSETAQILKSYRGTYAEQRALLIMGDLSYAKKDWKGAVASYGRLADRFPTSYLSPVSLSNAAAASEESGDLKGAIEFEKRILTYKGIAPELPEALFMLGRLYESQKDPQNAKTYYNQLIDQYPSSGWTKLARDRIIALTL